MPLWMTLLQTSKLFVGLQVSPLCLPTTHLHVPFSTTFLLYAPPGVSVFLSHPHHPLR
ncbi:hypothetical protein C8Q80DRAFT_1145990, partial [Daedaleopsis nitida]